MAIRWKGDVLGWESVEMRCFSGGNGAIFGVSGGLGEVAAGARIVDVP